MDLFCEYADQRQCGGGNVGWISVFALATNVCLCKACGIESIFDGVCDFKTFYFKEYDFFKHNFRVSRKMPSQINKILIINISPRTRTCKGLPLHTIQINACKVFVFVFFSIV